MQEVKNYNLNALNILKQNKKVGQYLDGRIIKKFSSVSEASKELYLKRDIILKCCKGKQKTYKGFEFKYCQ
jgi:hypothetical protein